MNIAKIALMIIMTLLVIVIFFALTGMNVKDPMPAVERIIAWTARLNRSVNARLGGFFSKVRSFILGADRDLNVPNVETEGATRPLQNFGRSIGNFFDRIFNRMRENAEPDIIEPITP